MLEDVGDERAGPPGPPGRSAAPWYEPLGSHAAAHLLARIIVRRSAAGAGPLVAVDMATGTAFAQDRLWCASLAPLVNQLALVPPAGWPPIVDRRLARWRRAAATVERIGTGSALDRHPRLPPMIVRLTTRAAGHDRSRTTRTAFGQLRWELVRDLGTAGLAAVVPGEGDNGPVTEAVWAEAAEATIVRHRASWAGLRPGSGDGVVILAGPHVSSILYRPGDVWRVIESCFDKVRATVVSNTMILVAGLDHLGPEIEAVADSLARFEAVGGAAHFERSTILLERPVSAM